MTMPTMVVDDQPDIRLLMKLLINGSDGFHVACEASSGTEALEMLDACDPAVVVLDQMMPGLTGLETAERILRLRPAQKIVFCSAYVDAGLVTDASDIGVRAVLPKEDLVQLPALLAKVMASGNGQSVQ